MTTAQHQPARRKPPLTAAELEEALVKTRI